MTTPQNQRNESSSLTADFLVNRLDCIDIIMMTLGLSFDNALEYIVNYFNSDNSH